MALRQVEGVAEYADLLRAEPAEVQALTQDFLIRVTGFFRDPDTFKKLAEKALLPLLETRPPQDSLRIWVPGCASGEEVYSIAIVLMELLGERPAPNRIQIFGTDLSISTPVAVLGTFASE
jgi:two-component system CheB/CheR fusion protein